MSLDNCTLYGLILLDSAINHGIQMCWNMDFHTFFTQECGSPSMHYQWLQVWCASTPVKACSMLRTLLNERLLLHAYSWLQLWFLCVSWMLKGAHGKFYMYKSYTLKLNARERLKMCSNFFIFKFCEIPVLKVFK